MKTIYLERVSCDIPWGFRMVGGCDYGQPIVVHKVSGGSIASGNLIPGDVLVQVMEQATESMTHNEAMQAIKSAETTLQLSLIRTDDDEEAPTDALSFQQQPSQQQQQFEQQQPQEEQQQPFIPQNYSNPPEALENFDFSPVHDAIDECTQQPASNISIPPPPGICQDQDHLASNNFYNNGFDNGKNENNPYDYNNNYDNNNYDNNYNNNNNNDDNNYNNNNDDNNYNHNDSQSFISPLSPHLEPQKVTSPTSPPVDIFSKSSIKPFTYVTDIHDIQAQREKIRKKGLNKKTIPAYQSLINLPYNFHSNSPQQQLPPDNALVENLQFNSPLQLYSSENIVDSLKEQTGAEVSGVVGLEEKKPSSIQQSEVYKMIHEPASNKPSHAPYLPINKAPNNNEESSGIDRTSIYKMSKFGKVNRGNKDPSKSFRRLQNMTGASPAFENQHHHSKPTIVEPEASTAESTDF